MNILLYTDVSRYRDVVGYCFLFIQDGRMIAGPITGTFLSEGTWYPKLHGHVERYPIKKGIRRYPDAILMTDHTNDVADLVKEYHMVDKRDPWHLTCHYAAKFAALHKLSKR